MKMKTYEESHICRFYVWLWSHTSIRRIRRWCGSMVLAYIEAYAQKEV